MYKGFTMHNEVPKDLIKKPEQPNKESRICANCGETILGESLEIAIDVNLCRDCSGVKMCDCCGHVDEIEGDECPLCGGEML